MCLAANTAHLGTYICRSGFLDGLGIKTYCISIKVIYLAVKLICFDA